MHIVDIEAVCMLKKEFKLMIDRLNGQLNHFQRNRVAKLERGEVWGIYLLTELFLSKTMLLRGGESNS